MQRGGIATATSACSYSAGDRACSGHFVYGFARHTVYRFSCALGYCYRPSYKPTCHGPRSRSASEQPSDDGSDCAKPRANREARRRVHARWGE